MRNQAKVFLALAILVCLVPASGLALEPYYQNFETLNQADTGALAADGWLVYGNVFGLDWSYWYGYGPFAAPNDGAAFCAIATGEGQGAQALSVYSDYNNTNHPSAYIQSLVFQELPIGPGDVGETWTFEFDAKMGNLAGSSTAQAFLKTLDPGNGYATTNEFYLDMTAIPTTWGTYQLSIVIDPALDGQLLQIGFLNIATNYEPSGVFYDNINLYISGSVVPTEETSWGEVKSLFR
jgi:hypothetical protein